MKKKTKMDFDAIKEYTEILKYVAKKKIPEDGWSFFVTYWEDNTFQLEYRRAREDGIHRFFYSPHKNKNIIKYYICGDSCWMTAGEGTFEIGTKITKKEELKVGEHFLLPV